VSSPYTDLERPPLREVPLRRALLVPDGLWTELNLVAETGSTNADLASAARAGRGEGAILVAERQSAGRGRLGRVWQSPPRAGIAVSVLVRPGRPRDNAPAVPTARFGWVPLLAGVALVEAVRRLSEVDAVLKWPNDLLIGERKCAGILAETVGADAVVIGIGLNTTVRQAELPGPGATSLALAGAACVDRDPLLRAVLRGLEHWYLRWRQHGGDAGGCGLKAAYELHCGTLGRQVRVELPGGRRVVGVATGIDVDGRLVVSGESLAAGDVIYVR
jgi:BirA family biotin operon repressor/biotin-[acetyl-CoA-carboxylase] ligase